MESPEQLGRGRVELPWLAVATHRVIWAALVAGQVAAAVVFAIVLNNGDAPRAPRVVEGPGVVVSGVLLLLALVVTVIIRRRGVRGMTEPSAIRRRYGRNLLVPMALLEASSFFALCLIFVTGRWVPTVAVPATSLVVQLLLFPRRTVRT